jgi:hypothetical protein
MKNDHTKKRAMRDVPIVKYLTTLGTNLDNMKTRHTAPLSDLEGDLSTFTSNVKGVIDKLSLVWNLN